MFARRTSRCADLSSRVQAPASRRRSPLRHGLRVLAALVAPPLWFASCADLGVAPKQTPSRLAIVPSDAVVAEGDPFRLGVAVFDQDGVRMPGPPSWAPPEWLPSDPEAIAIGPDGAADLLRGADMTVRARLAGLEAVSRLRIIPADVALSVPAAYLNQGAQSRRWRTPAIAGRPAVARVFVTGDQPSWFQPRIRVSFVLDGRVVHAALLDAPEERTPTEFADGRIEASYNVSVPGRVVQPGLEVEVEFDPEGRLPLSPGAPSSARLSLGVRQFPVLRQIIVPVDLLDYAGDEKDILGMTAGLTADHWRMWWPRALLPIGEMTVVVEDLYRSNANLRNAAGWSALLSEMRIYREMDGTRGYYYGAVEPPSQSPYAGLGNVGFPVAVGYAPGSSTFAHELGHTMNLLHAPCGGPGFLDADFPYADGSVGSWGYDATADSIVAPHGLHDVMSYCRPRWISDYSFQRAAAFRLEEEHNYVAGTAASRSRQSVLLLWGRTGPGGPALEPAFVLNLPPSPPRAGGPYRLAGFDEAGRSRFSFGFAPLQEEFGGEGFAFLVPYDPERDGPLDRVVLSGPGGSFTLRRTGEDPMAMVTDPATGKLRAILRNWNGVRPAVLAGGLDVVVSEGLSWTGRR